MQRGTKDTVLCRRFREPLNVGEEVLTLAERIKKKVALGNLYKSTSKNMSFFNCEQLFIVRKIVENSDINYYWIFKEGEDKLINKHFLRQELHAKMTSSPKKWTRFSSNTIIPLLIKTNNSRSNLAMEMYSTVLYF